jgi:hypothetical protein
MWDTKSGASGERPDGHYIKRGSFSHGDGAKEVIRGSLSSDRRNAVAKVR